MKNTILVLTGLLLGAGAFAGVNTLFMETKKTPTAADIYFTCLEQKKELDLSDDFCSWQYKLNLIAEKAEKILKKK